MRLRGSLAVVKSLGAQKEGKVALFALITSSDERVRTVQQLHHTRGIRLIVRVCKEPD